MKASEFIKENKTVFGGKTSEIDPSVVAALPATYSIPKLQNNDPYHQYRFGVAIAAAKGRTQRAKDGVTQYYAESPWGENEVIVSYDPHIAEWIDDALVEIGLSPSDKKLITSMKSQETSTVVKTSPIQGFKGYER